MPELVTNFDPKYFEGYRILEKLGSGSYGVVYHALKETTGKDVAIKISQNCLASEDLRKESRIYDVFNRKRAKGIPRKIRFGNHGRKKALVLQLLGPSLEEKKSLCGGWLSPKCVLQIAIQLLYRIELIHEVGFVHGDLKPGNILVGRGNAEEENTLYVVDFGLAKGFRTSQGGHIQEGEAGFITGTTAYCSLNSHNRKELSRRDDLISIGYVLADLCLGQLPWSNITIQDKNERRNRIQIMKRSRQATEMFHETNLSMTEYMDIVQNLGFEEYPEYSKLRQLFREDLRTRNLSEKGPFQWR